MLEGDAVKELGTLVPGSQASYQFRNLIGVPSCHFDPLFAQEVVRVIQRFPPSVVALELPPGLEAELGWASSCWPCPVAVVSGARLFPFVPGDSMFEAFRAARERQIPTVSVDVLVQSEDDIEADAPADGREIPGPDLISAGGFQFLRALQAALDQTPASDESLIREAAMAQALHQLMADHASVLWVGGMAHWRNILARLQRKDFSTPEGSRQVLAGRRRFQLAPSALFRLSQRLPALVQAYARNPQSYDERQALQDLALAAVPPSTASQAMIVTSPNVNRDPFIEPERAQPLDAAKTLLYARNLALSSAMRERPRLGELLTAAAATVDGFYAGRLYREAMQTFGNPGLAGVDELEYEQRDGGGLYTCRGEVIAAVPWLRAESDERAMSLVEAAQRSESFLQDLPKREPGEDRDWLVYPPVWTPFAEFVDFVMRSASTPDSSDSESAPFVSGMRDGLDIRRTLRNWRQEMVFVREGRRGKLNITNAAIDWINTSEQSDILQGRHRGGWIDPSQPYIGLVSRESEGSRLLLQEDPHIQITRRDFTLMSLDLPTWIDEPDDAFPKAKTFYSEVIKSLVDLQRSEDRIYGWLEVMFRFCRGKPFAYYSLYVPSERIRMIARAQDVQLVHLPLHRIPDRFRRRFQQYCFMLLTAAQKAELGRRRNQASNIWGDLPAFAAT